MEDSLYTTHAVTSADGTTIGYRQYGSGPGLVLVHGSMMSAQSLGHLALILAGRYTVYVPDRRGRGMSGPCKPDHTIRQDAEDLQALLEQTNAHKVFGLSSGAMIALACALQSDAIRELAVYEPPIPLTGQISTVDWLPRFEQELAADNLGAALLTVARGTGDVSLFTRLPRFINVPLMNMAIRTQAKAVLSDELPLRSLIPLMRQDARVVADMKDTIEHFSAVQAETLLMNGSDSPSNLKAPVQQLNRVLSNARPIVLHGAGHLAATNGKQPEIIARALVDFFAPDPADPQENP